MNLEDKDIVISQGRYGYLRVECDYPLVFCPACGHYIGHLIFHRLKKGSATCLNCLAMITHG